MKKTTRRKCKKGISLVVHSDDDRTMDEFLAALTKALPDTMRTQAITATVTDSENGKTYSALDYDWTTFKPKADAVAFGDRTPVRAYLPNTGTAVKHDTYERVLKKSQEPPAAKKPLRNTTAASPAPPASPPQRKPLRRTATDDKVDSMIDGGMSSIDKEASKASGDAVKTLTKRLKRKG